MKKVITTVGLLAMLLVCLCSCSTPPEQQPVFRTVTSDKNPMLALVANWTFDDAVDHATNVVTATFVGYRDAELEGDYELEFTVGEELKGSCDESTIFVYISPSHWTGQAYEEYNFIEDQDYLLILEEHISVRYEHSHYYLLCNIFAPLTYDVGVYMRYAKLEVYGYGGAASSTNLPYTNNDWLAHTKMLCDNADEVRGPVGIPFTTCTEIGDIIENSEFVLLIRPKELAPGMKKIFVCEVMEKLKGDYDVPSEIRFSSATGAEFTIGKSYYAILNRADGPDSGSSVFAESSKNSLFDSTDAAAVAEINSALGLA